jgi:hypothetical protein
MNERLFLELTLCFLFQILSSCLPFSRVSVRQELGDGSVLTSEVASRADLRYLKVVFFCYPLRCLLALLYLFDYIITTFGYTLQTSSAPLGHEIAHHGQP